MARKQPEIAYRRVVPPGYLEATLTLEGTSPLLMNSGEVDREGEQYRAFYALGQKGKKSLDDEARLSELEWSLALYLDADIGPYIPGINVKEMLRSAATNWRKGTAIVNSLIVVEYRLPLMYDGPRDEVGLWAEGFRDMRMVANAGFNRGRVVRCRPCFDQWSVNAAMAYDPEDLDYDMLENIVNRSQKYGLGDGRKIGFGSFVATLTPGDKTKPGAITNGTKAVNARTKTAHEAAKAKVMVD